MLTREDFRSYYDPEEKRQKTYGNIYFHLTMECLKYPNAVLENVKIGNDTLCLFADNHLKYLKMTGVLESTIKKRRDNL